MEYIYHYLGGVAELIAVIQADSSVVYVHSDHLSTPRLTTNADGIIVWRWVSEAFGEGLPNEDVDGDGELVTINHRFPGQYFDRESELSYNYFRDYDASLGRYVQSDPIGLAGGINTFGYVGGGPLASADPDGLVCGTGACVGTVILVGKGIKIGWKAGSKWWSRAKAAKELLRQAKEAADADEENTSEGQDCPYAGGTPDDKPQDFKPGERPGDKINKNDGSIWSPENAGANAHAGSKWKRWPNKKDRKNGKNKQSVRPNGSVR